MSRILLALNSRCTTVWCKLCHLAPEVCAHDSSHNCLCEDGGVGNVAAEGPTEKRGHCFVASHGLGGGTIHNICRTAQRNEAQTSATIDILLSCLCNAFVMPVPYLQRSGGAAHDSVHLSGGGHHSAHHYPYTQPFAQLSRWQHTMNERARVEDVVMSVCGRASTWDNAHRAT